MLLLLLLLLLLLVLALLVLLVLLLPPFLCHPSRLMRPDAGGRSRRGPQHCANRPIICA